jgi:hypothetical protein
MNSWYLLVALSTVLCLPIDGQAPKPDKPLPELNEFIKGIRSTLHSDRLLLSQYTFTEKDIERNLDKDGKVKSTDEEIHEIYPSLEEGLTYERLISKNGKPLSQKDLDKQDRKHDKKMQERAQQLEREGTSERAKRLAKEAEEKRKEEETLDDLFRLYEIRMAGRETQNGYQAILLTFDPRPEYKPRTRDGKFLEKIKGRAWICEEDHQLVRIEATLIDNLTLGMGVLARLNKGATAVFERRKVNNEIWLPAQARFTGSARLLLLKGMRIDASSEYSDYRKFTVETRVKYGAEKDP